MIQPAPAAEPAPAPGEPPESEPAPRAPRMRWWVALLLLLGAVATVGWGLSELSRSVEASDFTRVETARTRFEPAGLWSDPRWDAEISALLLGYPDFAVEDADAQAAIASALGRLSFVHGVGRPEVLWPDGLRVPIELRQPVACIGQGGSYLLVAADGTVLSGAWPSPPRIGDGWLPVLLGEQGEVPSARPGLVLSGRALRDALDWALELRAQLDPRDQDTLGRIAIDARHARTDDPATPGLQLLLEAQRLIAWGRPVHCDEPGELPDAQKWSGIKQGLAALRSQGADRDWVVLDVRWDVPAWRLREPSSAQPSGG